MNEAQPEYRRQPYSIRRFDLEYLRKRPDPGLIHNDMERISAAGITRETGDSFDRLRFRIEYELRIYHKTGYFRKLLQKVLQELNMHDFAVDWKNGKQELPNENWKHIMNSYVRLRDGKLG